MKVLVVWYLWRITVTTTLMEQISCLTIKERLSSKCTTLEFPVSRSVIEHVHTELVALFVVAMEVDSTGLEHPFGNGALSEI